MLNGLDLFSGIGGISIALKEWIRPVAYCEIDSYCQAILLSRMEGKFLRTAPIWDDIRNFPVEDFSTGVDIIYGGFPCQDISVAGNGKGLAGERSGLFFEIMRLAKEIKPKFLFLENVPAITSRGGIEVVRTIAEMGYDCRWCVISAASIGALHRRERWFLLGYSKHNGWNGIEKRGSIETSIHPCQKGKDETSESPRASASSVLASEFVADSTSACSKEQTSLHSGVYSSIDQWQKAVSSVCRVTDGLPFRVDRIRGLGNAVVPEQAKEAFKILMGLKRDRFLN